MPDEAEDTDDEDEEDEQTKFERLLSEGMLRMCLAKQSGVSVKVNNHCLDDNTMLINRLYF
jgi:hypothetical protein